MEKVNRFLVIVMLIVLPMFFCSSCGAIYAHHQGKKEIEEINKRFEKMPYGKQVLEERQK